MSISKQDFYNMLSPDEVILVTGVTYEVVRHKEIIEFSRCGVDMSNVYPIDAETAVYAETVVNLPIMEFGKIENGRNKRMYVAYSPEIEELLDRPYNVMHQDLENARDRIRRQDLKLRDYALASFWQRLKYLFWMDIKKGD